MKGGLSKLSALTLPILISGCSGFSDMGNKISDSLYPWTGLKAEDVCPGTHFSKLKASNLENSNGLKLYFLFSSKESYDTERAYFRYREIEKDNAVSIQRLPSVNQESWIPGAKWGMALSDMGADKNKNVIFASYEYFLSEQTNTSYFDKAIALEGYSASTLRDLSKTERYDERLQDLSLDIYNHKITSVPAIIINNESVVYPSKYDDKRDAWMAAHYLANKNKDISENCLIK